MYGSGVSEPAPPPLVVCLEDMDFDRQSAQSWPKARVEPGSLRWQLCGVPARAPTGPPPRAASHNGAPFLRVCYRRRVRLHLIDGTYELYRAHFSQRPPHTSPSGQDAKGTVGVVSSLLALLHDPEEAVTHVAAAFDNPIRSFRNDLFPDYKSDEGVPPEIHAQFDAVEE